MSSNSMPTIIKDERERKSRKKLKKQLRKTAPEGYNRGDVDVNLQRLIAGAKSNSKLYGGSVVHYALSLHDPEHYETRLPDSYPRRTALYRSIQEFDVPVSTSQPDPNQDGRFGIVLSPKLGDLGNPLTYRALVPRSDAAGWVSGNFSDASNFVPLDSSLDPRIDPEINLLSGSSGEGTLFLLGQETFRDTTGNDPLRFSNVNTAIQWDTTGITLSSSGQTSLFSFPALGRDMTYRIMWAMSLVDPNSSAVYASILNTPQLTDVLSAGVTFASQMRVENNEPPSGIYMSSAETGERHIYTYAASLNVPPAGGTLGVSSVAGRFLQDSSHFSVSLCKWRMHIQAVPRQGPVQFGLVSSIRPVSASLLLKWVGPTIEDAGKISAALGPRGSVSQNALTASPTGFNPFLWETYTRLQADAQSSVLHTGRLNKGAYVSWRPRTRNDVELYDTSTHNNQDFAPMCIAGQYSKSSGSISGNESVFLRARFVINFEYETSSRVPEISMIDRAFSDATVSAFNILLDMGIPIAMENDIHDFFRKVMEKVGGVISKGKAFIQSPIGQSLLTGLAAL